MAGISKEYAEALFILGAEIGSENEFLNNLKMISKSFEDNSDFLPFLSSPDIPMDKRTKALDTAFGDSVHEYVLSMVKLLCKKGRIMLFDDCIKSFNALLQAKNMKSEAIITTAVALTDDEKSAIRDKLEKIYNKTIELKLKIDPSILGGVVIELDSKMIDGSLRSKLQDIKDVMKQ